jgi:hypothetical protein
MYVYINITISTLKLRSKRSLLSLYCLCDYDFVSKDFTRDASYGVWCMYVLRMHSTMYNYHKERRGDYFLTFNIVLFTFKSLRNANIHLMHPRIQLYFIAIRNIL